MSRNKPLAGSEVSTRFRQRVTSIIFLALFLALPSGARAGIIYAGLVGYWTGNGNANDSSVNGNNGTFSGDYAAGLDGQAFDLSTGFVTIPNIGAYALGANFSVGFWFNLNGGSADTTIAFLGQDDGAGSQPKWFIDYDYLNLDAFEMLTYPPFVHLGSNQVALPSGWNQFTLVSNGGSYSYYLNGVDIGDVSNAISSLPAPAAPLTFGFVEGGLGFGGLMQDVTLYNVALSPNQVGVLASPGPATPEPGTLALLACGAFGIGLIKKARRSAMG